VSAGCTASPVVRWHGQWMAAQCAAVSLAHANQLPFSRSKALVVTRLTSVRSAIAITDQSFILSTVVGYSSLILSTVNINTQPNLYHCAPLICS